MAPILAGPFPGTARCGRPRRRGLPNDVGQRSVTAENVLDRQFSAEAPNQKWVADFTYIWTAEGWLYVDAMTDLFSRRVVGWSIAVQAPSETTPPWRASSLR